MGTKTVSVSTDDSTYYVLPGSQGDIDNQSNAIDDTIFGQNYKSSQTGLIGWTADGQAFYKGFAGYVAKILQQGSTTGFTGEATTQIGSSKSYQITNAAKQIFDPSVAVVVYDNGVDHTADVVSINYLFGTVTFNAGYSVTGPVTLHSGSYFPKTALGTANSYTLTQTADAVETTDFATAQANGGYRTFEQGLQTVQLELDGFYDVTNGLRALLLARTTFIVEINPDGNEKSLARGFFQVSDQSQSGNVGALEEEKVTFMLQVPSSSYIPFGWQHTSDTTLHQSMQEVLNAWLTQSTLHVKYLYDGTNGQKGIAVVTETTMKGGVDAMNEFTVKFQGTGGLTTVGTG